MQDIKNRMDELISLLIDENEKYYNGLKNNITNYEYDMYIKELEDLENKYPKFVYENSPTKRVGSDLNSTFEKVAHTYPMLSIGNTYNKEEMEDFIANTEKMISSNEVTYAVEPKIDGLSLSLVYIDKKLVHAVTRGDGVHGDDVTQNAMTIKDIPLKLTSPAPMGRFEVRGEVYMDNVAFEELNRTLLSSGKKVMQNPRNAAVGSLKLKKAIDAIKRPLRFIAYNVASDIIINDKHLTANHSENLELLSMLGFKVNSCTLVNNAKAIMQVIDNIDKKRKFLNFEIDGAVVKVNSLLYQQYMGNTSKSPRWVIAYKYNAVQVETKVTSVDYQVGRTGAITPVANLKPIRLCGTTVKRATLHNFEEVKRLNIHIGDTVIIEKGGEIIPKIIKVVESKHKDTFTKIEPLVLCPVCSSLLVETDGEVALRCENLNCPAQVQRLLEHFVSRQGMNIDGIGPSVIEQLIIKGVSKPIDLYKVSREQLETIDRMGEKSITNFLESIDESKSSNLEHFIFALGIRYVGKGTSKRLAKRYQSLEEFMEADLDELENIEDIGQKTAESIYNYVCNKDNYEMMDEFLDLGMTFQTEVIETSSKLSGKTLVITGTLPSMSRTEATKIAESAGANVTSTVSRSTDYLLAGEKAGGKLLKAKHYGIKIITQSEFMELAN